MQITDFINETLSACAAELVSRFRSGLEVRSKSDASLVTEADLASETVALKRIREAFPDDLILSEETHTSARSRPEGKHVWIIDPLDGTTNFANGYPYFCVSIARGVFRADGSIQVVAGGIIDPLRRKSYLAELGKGAWSDGVRLRVRADRPLAKTFLVTGFYFTAPEKLLPEVERFARVAQSCPAIRRDGAAALDLALVAEGIFDAFWENGLQVWDVAAGSLLVTEAGGVVQNYPGVSGSYDLEKTGIVAGNPATVASIAALL
jgi:myo-inositol-1(or 4)-monophosphatase